MSDVYRSPYEAYPFLADASDDLRCDFELLTDEMASLTGALRAVISDSELRDELEWVCELIYHLNPSLRTFVSITAKERDMLLDAVNRLKGETDCKGFVLPMGCRSACDAHVLRVKAKMLVRLLYRYIYGGHTVSDIAIDTANLLSGYFFYLALKLNADSNTSEREFVSRNYSKC
jgi:cob(I)alamin adenosyltransferase